MSTHKFVHKYSQAVFSNRHTVEATEYLSAAEQTKPSIHPYNGKILSNEKVIHAII